MDNKIHTHPTDVKNEMYISLINMYPSELNISFYTPKRQQIGENTTVPITGVINRLIQTDVGVLIMDVTAVSVNREWSGTIPIKISDPLILLKGKDGELVVTYNKMIIPGGHRKSPGIMNWTLIFTVILMIIGIIAGWSYYKKCK